MLAVVGDSDDLTIAYVAERARRYGAAVVVLDEAEFGDSWTVVYDDPATTSADGRIETLDGAHDLRLVDGIYVRYTPAPEVPAALEDDAGLAETYARERRLAINAFLQVAPVPVANRPGRGQANGSKPLQMAELGEAGFAVPRWIATNDPIAATALAERSLAGAVVKSCTGTRSEVVKWSPEFAGRLGGSPPVVVQTLVEGADVRVHTVGDRVFPTWVVGSGERVDYRFDTATRRFDAGSVPSSVAARCVQFAHRLGLMIAGFDFRVDSGGAWWCLECNPAPTFLPYELETGQPIADALLADLGVTPPT